MLDSHLNSHIRMRMLRYFHVLAVELHFGRAAARLNITQPPLSMQIKALEEALDVTLFIRSSRKVRLTPAGKILQGEVEQLLNAADVSLNYVRQMGRCEKQHIHIGIVGSAVWGPLLARMKQFRESYPAATWTLHELGQQQQIEALRAHSIDIAISRHVLPESHAAIRCQLIIRESLCLAVPETDSLCRAGSISLVELASRHFISLSMNHSNFARQVAEHCRALGMAPRIVHQVHEPQTALALVSAGNGVALLPESCALIRWPGVTFMRLKQAIPADLYAQWQQQKTLPPLLSDFILALRGKGMSTNDASASPCCPHPVRS